VSRDILAVDVGTTALKLGVFSPELEKRCEPPAATTSMSTAVAGPMSIRPCGGKPGGMLPGSGAVLKAVGSCRFP